MTNQIEQGSRLKTLISLIGVTQLALSQRLGFTPGYISLVVNGEKPMSQKFLNKLSECYPKVNINWLLRGLGDPINEDELGKSYQFHDSKPITLEEMESQYSNDPFRGLREMYVKMLELEKRIIELEQENRKQS